MLCTVLWSRWLGGIALLFVAHGIEERHGTANAAKQALESLDSGDEGIATSFTETGTKSGGPSRPLAKERDGPERRKQTSSLLSLIDTVETLEEERETLLQNHIVLGKHIQPRLK